MLPTADMLWFAMVMAAALLGKHADVPHDSQHICNKHDSNLYNMVPAVQYAVP